MKYILSEKILDYKGQPIKEGGQEVSWKDIIFTSCNNPIKKDEEMSPADKLKAYRITTTAYSTKDGEETEMSVDDIAFVLKRIDVLFMPNVVGEAHKFFEGK